MKRKLKSMSLLLVSVMMTTVIAACSKTNESPSNAPSNNASPATNESKTLDPVSLKVMLFGEKPADMDKVLAEFENRSKETINTKLDMTFDLPDQYPNKLKLKLAAGEEFDLAFDAPWWNMNQNISNGYYQELDKYFNNDEYPGLKAAFSPEYLESNKTNGHIYAVPITNFFTDLSVVTIRKDLREKYGLEPVQSYDDLEIYLDKAIENNPEMIPLATHTFTFKEMFANYTDKQTNIRSFPYDIGGTAAWFNIVLSQDGKKVLGATTIGDPAADYAEFPAPYNSPDYSYSYLDKRVEFRKYLPKDPFAQRSAGGPKAAASQGTLNGMAQANQELMQTDGTTNEIFIYNDAARNMEPGAIGTNHKAWNFLVVPKTSKNTDRVMKYLDWLFSNKENHDLFELGIEGVHWTKDGENYYKETENAKNYRFPGYEMSWNPTLSRVNSNNDPEVLKYIEYQAKNDSYYSLPLSGFTFNTEAVKSEVAKVQPKFDEFNTVVLAGVDPDWKTKAAAVNKQLRSLGLEKIRAELLKQVQAYLDNGGK